LKKVEEKQGFQLVGNLKVIITIRQNSFQPTKLQ